MTPEPNLSARAGPAATNDTSVYLAYPGQDAQIELFDPEPGRALEQARSGAVVPLG